MSVKQIFLQQIDNFTNELCSIFPTNGSILLLSGKYNLLKNANSSLILEYFIKFIYPHKERICNEDESFFIEGGGQEEVTDSSGLKFRDNLKNLWLTEMSSENKEIVWKYFKIFILLSEKYILEYYK